MKAPFNGGFSFVEYLYKIKKLDAQRNSKIRYYN